MITTELAYSIRFESGLQLPINKQYDSDRLKEIAIEQHDLIERLNTLDNEISTLYNNIKFDYENRK